MKYTERIHANRVLKMLFYRRRICSHCPAGQKYQSDILLLRRLARPCGICKAFVNINSRASCPCIILGQVEAITRTAKALKDKGYITGKLAIKALDDRVKYLTKEG